MSYLFAVDDDASTLFLIEELFRRAGFDGEFVSALGGDEVLAVAAEREPPALMLLDLRMPITNGFELLQALAAKDLWPDVPVIVHTSSQRPADHTRAREFPQVVNVVEKMLTTAQAGEWMATYFGARAQQAGNG